MALNYVTITDTLLDGSGANGTALPVFTPSQTIVVPGLGVITPQTGIQGQYVSGQLKNMQGTALQLLATDNSVTIEGSTGFWFWTVSGLPNGLTFSFFLPHTPTTVDLAALINTQAGGSSVSFPITIAEGGTGQTTQQAALDALAVPGTAGRVLRDTGTHAQFGALLTSDLPGALKPWQFRPEDYGAKGYSGVAADVVTNGTTTITSATANWTGHNGEHIMINGANGATSGPLLTTIVTGGNGTATLAAAAGASATGCAAVWGPDDQAAVNSAISALETYALANNYFGELYCSTFYVCASAPTQTTTPIVQNAQIPIPQPGVNGQSRRLVIGIRGPGKSGMLEFWESVFPNLQGAGFISMTTAPSTPSVTYGEQSVIGGPSGTSGLTGSFANTTVLIDGITIWTPVLNNMYAYDFGYTAGVEFGSFGHKSFAPANNSSGATAAHPYLADLPGTMVTQLENTIGVGCRFPLVGNNDDVVGASFASEGTLIGAIVGDHFTALRMATLYVDVGGRIDLVNGISGGSHGVFVGNWSIESYNGAITCNGSGAAYCSVNINLDTEPIAGGDPVYDINDSGALHGTIRITDNGARTNRRPVILNGAPNLNVVNDLVGPVVWTNSITPNPPAAPGNNVAQTNNMRNATVWVSATTGITAVSIDGNALGLTAGNNAWLPLDVAFGHSFTVTYTGTLTTKWILKP